MSVYECVCVFVFVFVFVNVCAVAGPRRVSPQPDYEGNLPSPPRVRRISSGSSSLCMFPSVHVYKYVCVCV